MLNSTKGISSTQSNLSSNETPSSATEDHPENPPRLESRPPPNIPINTEGQRFREDSELFDDHEGSNDHQTIGELRNTLTTVSLDTEASEQTRQDKTVSIRGRTSNQTKAATGSVASQYERLESAIKNGDIQTTKQLIDQENDEGLTPLMMAIVTGNTIFAKLLISNDAAIGKANKRGDTPLTLACTHNQPAILAMMLARLTSHTAVDTLSPRGLTLLMHAADSGNENIVKLLLDHGATMDMPGKFNWTALTLAAQSGHTSVVELLLDRGAAIAQVNNNGRTALMLASKTGKTSIVKLLLERGAVPDQVNDNDGITALKLAFQHRHTSVLKILLGHGAMPDQVSHGGQTLLMLACKAGDIDVAELLLAHGAMPDRTSNNGWTPLMFACKAGHTSMAKLLLAHGAMPDQVNHDGQTPLMLACEAGDIDAAELLLNRGARPDQKSKNGWTALMLACKAGHTPIAKLLLANDAVLDGETASGRTPLMIACKYGKVEIVRLLVSKADFFSYKHPRPLKAMVETAALSGRAEVLKFLFERSKNLASLRNDIEDSWFDHLANVTLKEGHHEALSFLMAHGIRPDPTSNATWESIMKAADKGNIQLLRLMFNEFASSLPLSPGSWINTDAASIYLRLQQSLIHAAHHDRHEIARLLITAGGKPDYIIDGGKSALKESILRGNLKMLILMLDQNIELSRQHPGDKLSNELLLAISSHTPDPMLIDTLLNFEIEKKLNKGSFSFALDFTKLFDGVQKLIAKSYEEIKKGSFPHKVITIMLCTECNLSYFIAHRLVLCLQKIINLQLSRGNTKIIDMNQLRVALTDSVISEQLFNDLSRGEDRLVEKCYAKHAEAPALATKLFRVVASQALLLIAVADTEAKKYEATLQIYFNALTADTTSHEIEAFMTKDGWHPFVRQLVVECWESLNGSRTKAALFEAINARLSTTEFAEKFDKISSDTLRLLLHPQMIRLRETMKG